MKWQLRLALPLAFSVLVTACELPGTSHSNATSDTIAASTVTVDPASGSVLRAAADDLCAGFDPFATLNARGAFHTSLIESMGVPTSYMADRTYFEMSPVGPDGAMAMAHDLVSGPTFCDLDVSPAMAKAINDAISSSDPIQAMKDLLASVGYGSGEFGMGLMVPGESAAAPDPLAAVRMFISLEAEAMADGDSDGAEFAHDLATETYTKYANDAIDTSGSESDLVTIAAGAYLLGLEELGDEAFGKAEDIAKNLLDKAAQGFSKCTSDQATVKEFFSSLARSTMLSGGDPHGGTVVAWIDVQNRRKSGKPVPECDGGDFTASAPLPAGWSGTITVHLTSCDSVDWTGDLLAVGTLNSDGAQMTMDSSVPLTLTTDDGSPGSVFHGDFGAAFDTNITAGDMSGTGHANFHGSVEFVVAEGGSGDATAALTMNFEPGVFHLELQAAGRTFTRDQPVEWGDSKFDGPVTSGGQGCDS